MEHEQRKITVRDGTSIHVERWTPPEVRFVVVIAHGGAEHVGRFAGVAEMFAARGGLVFGPDHRGQGLSGGIRGHVERFEDFASDLRQVMLKTAGELPEAQRPEKIPWFLFGHSMGGLIALVYLLQHQRDVPLRGALIMSPLLGLTMKVNPIKLAVGKVASRLLPKLALPTGIPPEHISRDPDVVERYRRDTRRVQVVTAGWFAALNQAIARVEREIDSIEIPMRICIGTGDLICDPAATERIFRRIDAAEARDQSLERFTGYYHELHNEPPAEREPVFASIASWVEARLER